MTRPVALIVILSLIVLTFTTAASADEYLQIGGVYPHLSTFNQPESGPDPAHGEAGIGAIVSWADRLWYLTYPQHKTRGSNDKLYEVDPEMNLTIRPESVGGTHACRMIHRESEQLIIGPYFIDKKGNVRVCDLNKLVGRMTAVMRHLTDPANMVYFFDMEGAIYEVNVHSLEVKRLYSKPFPGWHGKGAYTSQGRVVFANNGEREQNILDLLVGRGPKGPEDAGILCEWDGKDFNIILRRQFTDVTGPGGIYGAPDDKSPLWAMGWDHRSVLLMLLDDGRWSTYRLPKASLSFDHRHGYYTEWPRIREFTPDGRWMACMHGAMYDFPPTFSRKNSAGIRPLVTHVRYVPDFTHHKGQIVIGADEAAMMGNPLAGQAQSNLWFGTLEELKRFGPQLGYGGVWRGDEIQAGTPSDPYLFAGYRQRCAYLKHSAKSPVSFKLEVDVKGDGNWTELETVVVPPSTTTVKIFESTAPGEWIRVTSDTDCIARVYFQYFTPREDLAEEKALFDGLADIDADVAVAGGPIRPSGHNRTLQWLRRTGETEEYVEIDLDGKTGLRFEVPEGTEKRVEYIKKIGTIKPDMKVDRASVIVTRKDGRRFRLPKGPATFDTAALRGVREVQSERWLAQLHGTFYEMPRWSDNHSPDFEKMKPVASHTKRIEDFCTWRGLLVLCGVATRTDGAKDPRIFRDQAGRGLWFGNVDDLWKLGKPRGQGGPWYESAVKAGEYSDPYLMLGYDKKQIRLSHDRNIPVVFTMELEFDHSAFVEYRQILVPAGRTAEIEFPEGLNAHWIRLKTDTDCSATAWLTYE